MAAGVLCGALPPNVNQPPVLPPPPQGDPRQHATWLASRPRRFEQTAVRALLGALRATAGSPTKPGFRLHIVHLSGERELDWCTAFSWQSFCRVPLARHGTSPAALLLVRALPDTPAQRCCAPCTCADADLLPELAAAKAEGLPLSVETCPHYLNFAAEAVPEGDTRWGSGAVVEWKWAGGQQGRRAAGWQGRQVTAAYVGRPFTAMLPGPA